MNEIETKIKSFKSEESKNLDTLKEIADYLNESEGYIMNALIDLKRLHINHGKKYLIICVAGKTRSGKDTICKRLKLEFGIEPFITFTTRPPRSYELNGREHYFITEEDLKQYESKLKLAEYKNENTGSYYFSLGDALPNNIPMCSYIINPNAVSMMCDRIIDSGYKEYFQILPIFLDCDDDVILERAQKNGDDLDVVKFRLESEQEEFNVSNLPDLTTNPLNMNKEGINYGWFVVDGNRSPYTVWSDIRNSFLTQHLIFNVIN